MILQILAVVAVGLLILWMLVVVLLLLFIHNRIWVVYEELMEARKDLLKVRQWVRMEEEEDSV